MESLFLIPIVDNRLLVYIIVLSVLPCQQHKMGKNHRRRRFCLW
jgi:hypothetical protein